MVNQPKTTEDVPEISVIVPVYKEEENTRPFVDRMNFQFGFGALTSSGVLN